MNSRLEKDLKKTMEIISANWKMQNNTYDRATNFIYSMESLEECLKEIERRNVNKEYALHRWYNYMTSVHCEYIFCEYGAVCKCQYKNVGKVENNNVCFCYSSAACVSIRDRTSLMRYDGPFMEIIVE